MVKSKENTGEIKVYCPECGTPVKKGSFICLNYGLKVNLTGGKNKKQDRTPIRKLAGRSRRKAKKDDMGSGDIAETMPELINDLFNTKDNPKNQNGHPGWWNY